MKQFNCYLQEARSRSSARSRSDDIMTMKNEINARLSQIKDTAKNIPKELKGRDPLSIDSSEVKSIKRQAEFLEEEAKEIQVELNNMSKEID